MAESTAQVLSKSDFTKQSLISFSSFFASSPLTPSSIRVRTTLVALTANNITYAAAGTFLHWWSAYPVPPYFPEPYNDTSAYGIVPAWGYATVFESIIPSLPIGSLLWGYWPASTFLTDLTLSSTDPPGHWIETSSHRQSLMPLYNRYIFVSAASPLLASATDPSDLDLFAKTSLLKTLWESAYLLNRFVFSPLPDLDSPFHPLGTIGPIWSVSDSDLSSSAIIILASSGKTAASFRSELCHARPPGSGPLAIVNVSRNPASSTSESTNIPIKAVSYDSLSSSSPASAIDFLTSLSLSGKLGRIVIFDFGAPGSILPALLSVLSKHPSLEKIKTTTIGVGTDHRPGATQQKAIEGKIQSNASGARDAAMERLGPEKYFRDMEEAWEKRGRKIELGVRIGKGLSGDEGWEGCWRRMCGGKMSGEEGWAFVV